LIIAFSRRREYTGDQKKADPSPRGIFSSARDYCSNPMLPGNRGTTGLYEEIVLSVNKTRSFRYLLAVAIAFLAFAVYLPALQNDFLNWDDNVYVVENPFIRSFDAHLFREAFFRFTAGNWHPLTWISHALDYAVWGLNPWGHHLTNIVLHGVNTFLVVLLIMLLLEAARERPAGQGGNGFLNDRTILLVGAGTGLLFGLHPLHVESVAWVAERKDLLCALFFLLSIIAYTKYAIRQRSEGAEKNEAQGKKFFINKHYLLSLVLFVLALMSKPMAVSLPLVLLLLDWYPLCRISSFRPFRLAFFEKLPFVALSILSSLLTVLAQKSGGALHATVLVSLPVRLLVAARSVIGYLSNMFLPVHLIPYYAYPVQSTVSLFSIIYSGSFVLLLGITVFCIRRAKKQRFWISSWLYYIITLIPVIGIVQVGGQAMADRYTYLSSIGPSLIIALGVAWIINSVAGEKAKSVTLVLVTSVAAMGISGSLAYMTIQQTGVWKNSISLWSSVIEKEPRGASLPYNNRGQAFDKLKQYDKAINDYDMAIAADPTSEEAVNNRGVTYRKMGKIDRAIADFNAALGLNPSFYQAYNNRAFAFGLIGEFDKAMDDYDHALALNPSYFQAYNNRGLLYDRMGLADKAIEDFSRTIALNPSSELAYFNLGILYGKIGKYDKSLLNFDATLRLRPDFADGYLNRGITYFLVGQTDMALKDYSAAILLDKNSARAYAARGRLYDSTGQREPALADYQRACQLGDQTSCRTLQ
jgi:tetratricopeptide (TPR) repeat protein